MVRIASKNDEGGKRREDVYRITNISSDIVDTHLLVVVQGLADRLEVTNASAFTSAGDPYLREFLTDGVLLPDQSILVRIVVRRHSRDTAIGYSLRMLSGQGNP